MNMLEELDRIEKINIAYIKKHHNFSSMAIIYTDKGIQLLALLWRNYKEKEIMKMLLKKAVLKQKTQFYIFNADSLCTIMEKNGENKTYDCLMTPLCSPNKTIIRGYFHDGKGNPIKNPSEMKEEITKNWNSWNIWNETDIDITNDISEKYKQYKEENPDRFKSVGL